MHVGRSRDMQGLGCTMEPRGTAASGRIQIAPCSSCFQGYQRKGICPQNTLLSYAHAHTHEGAQRHNAGWGNPVKETQAPALVPPRCPWGDSTTVLNMMSEQESQSTLWTLWTHIPTWMSMYIELNKNKWYSGTFPTRLLQNLLLL